MFFHTFVLELNGSYVEKHIEESHEDVQQNNF